MEITQIMIGGFLIQDPMTLLTDLILGVQCLGLALLLWKKGKHTKEGTWIALFLLILGIGSIEGGIVNHGWYYLFGPGWKLPMVLLVGSSLPFVMMANIYSMRSLVSSGILKTLSGFVLLEYLCFLGYLATQPMEAIDFKSLVPHLSIGLLVFIPLLQRYAIKKDPHKSRSLMLWGIASTLPVGAVNILRISPDKWFNMYDLVHVLLMVTVYLFFLSGLSFANRQTT